MSNSQWPMYVFLGYVDLFPFQIWPFHVKKSWMLEVGGNPNLIFFLKKTSLSLTENQIIHTAAQQKFLVIYCSCCLVRHMIMACIVHKVDRATSTGFKRMEGNKNGQKESWLNAPTTYWWESSGVSSTQQACPKVSAT